MRRIRKLFYYDKKSTQELISFLNNNDTYINHLLFNPLIPLHYLLPLRFKFLPETYVLKDRKELKGLITVAPSKCPLKQVEIQRLFFEENCYEDAVELVQYAVSRYKALGTASFVVRIDSYLPELLRAFVSRCGFSQISYEKLWKVNDLDGCSYDKKSFREFRNSDSQMVTSLYNDSLLPHFRTLLGKDVKEFRDNIFRGLAYYNEYKYVIEDRKTRNIVAYVELKTADNENFILDIVQSSWAEIDFDQILVFAMAQIKKRCGNAKLFLRTKKYTQLGDKFEQMCGEKKFECVQNQIVLTNSSARIIREEVRTGKFTVLNQFYGIGAVNKTM